MWICHCKAVTDKDIEAAIDDGAKSTVDVALECQAGTGCGGCIPEVRRILRDRTRQQAGLWDRPGKARSRL